MNTKPKYNDRETTTGRYRTSRPCDCCGKPAGSDPLCDDEVCGNTDGPGFYICERKRCAALRASLSPAERASAYLARRAAVAPDCYTNGGWFWAAGSWHRTEPHPVGTQVVFAVDVVPFYARTWVVMEVYPMTNTTPLGYLLADPTDAAVVTQAVHAHLRKA